MSEISTVNNKDEADSTEIFGRKVFFINPAYSIRNDVIPALQKEEYEVYIIDSYKDAKNILRKYKNSMCFINVDAQLSIDAWFNFIKSFEKEITLKSTFIGVISERIKRDDRSIFLAHANIPGGIIHVDESMSAITKELETILLNNGAKGKRQYVRANLSLERDAALFWTIEDRLFQMKLLDISSVGMSVKVPAQMAPYAHEKAIVRDITLRLATKQFVVDAVVFAIKNTPEGLLWIMLLMPNTATSVKDAIRDYVAVTNQKLLMASINNKVADSTDYNDIPYYKLVTKRSRASDKDVQ
ncbi:MAG: hypothetical protein J6Z17_02245 [Treponema sp.]|nr:hypothetical protein [Treponema sp.]